MKKLQHKLPKGRSPEGVNVGSFWCRSSIQKGVGGGQYLQLLTPLFPYYSHHPRPLLPIHRVSSSSYPSLPYDLGPDHGGPPPELTTSHHCDWNTPKYYHTCRAIANWHGLLCVYFSSWAQLLYISSYWNCVGNRMQWYTFSHFSFFYKIVTGNKLETNDGS